MPSIIKSTLSFEELTNQRETVKWVQAHLIRLGLLDPPADGKFGALSKQALQAFQSITNLSESGFGEQTYHLLDTVSEAIPIKLGNDFASRIVRYMQAQKFFIAISKQQYNIVYIEGADADGTPNADQFNEWNDRRIVLEFVNGAPHIVHNSFATTEPGAKPTYQPSNPKGAARIAFSQYQAWQVGRHVGSSGFEPHEGLLQRAEVEVYRDRNRDGLRTGDSLDKGLFGINQHWGYDSQHVGTASAGCLVGQSRNSHRDFMALIKQDQRYQTHPSYLFFTTIISGDDLAKRFPA